MSKIKFENSKNNKKNKGKGFYIALGICLIAVGSASFSTYKSVKEYMYPSDYTNENTKVKPETKDKSDESLQDVINNTITEEKQKNDSQCKETNNDVSNEDKEELIIFPSSKEIIKNFSDNNPIYSKTFSDWRIHTGTDFKADNGSIVKSMNSGKVSDVFDDDSLGMTVVIEHDSGFTAYYSGLGNTVMVNKDDRVSTGQDIGSINDIPSEIADESHLHLGIKKDGKWIDPMTILKNE